VIRQIHGRVPATFFWPGVISARSVINVTAGEVSFGGSEVNRTGPGQNFFYHLGDADIWVSNICPRRNDFNRVASPGEVSFILHVDWSSPLDVAVTITVDDDLPVEIQGY